MAAIAGTFVTNHDQTGTVIWNLGNADTGNPVRISRYKLNTVQVAGTIGGATIVIQGSNDNVNYFTLNDDQGTPAALSFTAAALKNIRERPMYIRAQTSGGTGSAISVVINVSQGD